MKILVNILFFLIIFNFPVPGLYNSLIVAILIITGVYLRKGAKNKDALLLLKIIKTSQFYIIVLSYLFLFFITYLWAIAHQTNDFTSIKGMFLCFIAVIISVLYIPLAVNHLFETDDYVVEFSKLIVRLFVVQSIIQIMAFVEPSVAELVMLFRREKIQDLNYGGIRGLALTGNPFFRLSGGYGLSYICFFYLYFSKKIKYATIIFVLLFIGSFFAGRTAFIGLALAIVSYVIYSFVEARFLFVNIFRFLILIIIIISGVLLVYNIFVPENIRAIVDEKLLPYAFEFVYNYQNTGELTTSSSDHLNEMYFPISDDTLLYGDARYTADNGKSYYKHTDAGYMRNTLFYGVLGLIYLILAQIITFRNVLFSKIKINNKLYFLFILLFAFILHYKGEILLSSPLYQSIIVVFSFSYLFKRKSLICQN
ncbi:hypothetical protein [Tenacibaculum dicentrarchi]|uniref:hypothetical protein n=1 Tax=Tenacibaculum dicentrarchi TaxID=669041 RepID=UPI0035196B9D